MKFIFCFLLSIIFSSIALFSQCPHTPKCPFDSCYYGGDGLTKATAFQLWTIEHLMELRDSVKKSSHLIPIVWYNGKHFRLMQDIYDSIRQTIGITHFDAYFHGGGHKLILALKMNSVIQNELSLFGGTSPLVDSLVVEGYVIGGNTAIACGSDSIFHVVNNANVVNTFTIRPYGNYAAGISRINFGHIHNCINNGSITGYDRVGGIAAQQGNYHINGIVDNCINTGRIYATNSGRYAPITLGAGGIAGVTFYASILNCINVGTIEGENNVGGITGYIEVKNATLINNISYSFVKGENAVGGIVGITRLTSGANQPLLPLTNISNNSNFGVVVGEEYTGCIVGKNNGGNISNNHYDKQMCGE